MDVDAMEKVKAFFVGIIVSSLVLGVTFLLCISDYKGEKAVWKERLNYALEENRRLEQQIRTNHPSDIAFRIKECKDYKLGWITSEREGSLIITCVPDPLNYGVQNKIIIE